ncbi:MAG: Fic family protein [Natronosporangium sp.]
MRQYERTHPWLSFTFDSGRLSHLDWLRLGEALSKCDHVAGVPLQPAVAAELHEIYLAGLAHADDVTPGRTQAHSVVVNGYRGAPAEDCDYLLERLCTWLAGLCDGLPPELHRPMRIVRAILAHLYLAWIHPFGDGNGRTARLMEFQLLLEAGLPTPACHLLSNYYNRTRTRYYAVLAQTSRPPYPVEAFVSYAVQGFVEELREQLATIRHQQLLVAWVNYVHERFQGAPTPARRRQRDLVLSLPFDRPTPVTAIARLTPDLAAQYATRQHKTVVRDVNELTRMGLAERTPAGIRPLIGQLAAFLPRRTASD